MSCLKGLLKLCFVLLSQLTILFHPAHLQSSHIALMQDLLQLTHINPHLRTTIVCEAAGLLRLVVYPVHVYVTCYNKCTIVCDS